MTISIIVAMAANRAIGINNQLIWHNSNDLKHFKTLTMGHSIVMGRRTFESFPKGALPGRQNIVITHNKHYHPQGVTVVHSVDEALQAATMPGEIFIIGGAQIYAATIDMVQTLHLTRLHATFDEADAFFPAINPDEWQQLNCERHDADERNPYAYDFVTLVRKNGQPLAHPQVG